jgi:Cys-tRNA(Pro) deacylase
VNSILDKETVKRVEKILKDFDPNLDVVILEQTARTANDAATALGCNVGAIVKSLLFKIGDKFCLCLVSGDKRCSLNKLKKKLDEKDVSMANPEEVKQVTGYTIGGVSPIGHLVKIKIYMDKNLERFSKVFAAAGHPNAIFGISFFELKKLTNAEVDDLTE